MKTISSYLPVFPGFYGAILEFFFQNEYEDAQASMYDHSIGNVSLDYERIN